MWAEPILHVDMDSYFVEVERLRDPGLKGRPVAVGGTGRRGVIASASYEAREFGVHSAQPTATAVRLCPELIVVSPAHGRYGEVSVQVFEIFRSFTPLVEGLSLDEAFLDVGGLRHHFPSSVDVAVAIKERVRDELGLPASVGIAATKFVAKLASAAAKPNGYRVVPCERQLEFLHPLPVQELGGVGPATMAAMVKLGIETVGDLAELPENAAETAFGPAQGRHLIDLAHGRDPRPVEPDSGAKSISVEQTFDEDLMSREEIESCLLAHAQRLSGRLRRAGLVARTLTVKLRYSDFTTFTRSITFQDPVDTPRDLFAIGRELLDQLDTSRPVRLLGLGGASLEGSGSSRQMTLDSDENWDRIAAAVADVRDRYGDHSIEPARLLDEKSMEAED